MPRIDADPSAWAMAAGVGLLKRICKRNNPVVFDVGANKGEWSMRVLSVFPDAHVVAFEPEVLAFQKFCANITPIARSVSCFMWAVGDHDEKEGILRSDSPGSYLSTLRERKSPMVHVATQTKVPIVNLDWFCEAYGPKHVDMVKIDAELYDVNVLRGASRLIENRSVDIFQFECIPDKDFDITFKTFFDLLNANYHVGGIGGESIVRWCKELPISPGFVDGIALSRDFTIPGEKEIVPLCERVSANLKAEAFKLNLGCGDVRRDYFVNIDKMHTGKEDMVHDLATGIPFPDESCDEVYTHHMLEYMTHDRAWFVIRESYRVLKSGGTLMICCPDMEQVLSKLLVSNSTDVEETDRMMGAVFGQDDVFAMRRYGYTQETLERMVIDAGFMVTSNIKQSQCGGDGIELRARK